MIIKNNTLKTISCIITFLAVMFFSNTAIANQIQISQFVSPEACADCHSEIFDQWENSMHGLAHTDPIYNKVALFLIKGLKDKDEIKEAESCVKCHTPIGYVTGNPKKLSDNLDKVPEIAKKGIQCDYCHSATGAKKIYNNDLQLEPGQGEDDPGVKYGPFDDSEPDFHEAEFSKFHTESKICGTCHNVKHVVFNTDIETTYTEWEKSPYNSKDIKKRITCQGCHMYQRPGIPATGSTKRPLNPGAATDYSVEREHIFTHYFVGGNKVIPQSINDKTRAEMAVQRLKNAATIKISTKEIQKDIININITNTGAGHSIPTGLTDIRQVWLKIVLKDTTGKIIFSSGELDKNNYLEKDAICYKTVFGDGKGKPVANVAKAKEIIKDYRIPALKSVTEKIKLPKGNKKGMSLTVELLYRSISHKLIDAVGGEKNLKPEVVVMAQSSIVL